MSDRSLPPGSPRDHDAGAPKEPVPTSPQGGEDRVRVLSVLVEDNSGTLSKVSGPSREPGRFRMTLEVDAGHAEADQVLKQLERLVDVVEVEDLTDHDVHSRELVVARVAVSEVSALVDKGARVLDTGPTWTTIEFAGEGEEVGGFVDELRRHGILDVVRSGPVVMRRTAS